jgi:hypothetical protein
MPSNRPPATSQARKSVSGSLSSSVGNSETGFDETWDSNAGIQDVYNLAESAGTVLSSDQTHVLKGYIAFNPQGHNLGNGKRLYAELRGFGYANEDLGILKGFQVKDRVRIQLRAEFLNAFNRHHFADPNTSLGNSTTFGYVTTVSGSPRIVQFGLRMDW